MNNSSIIKAGNCKLTNEIHLELVKEHSIDFFPSSTISEQKYVVASYSTSLYKSIYGGNIEKMNDVRVALSEETVTIISKSHLYNNFRNSRTLDELQETVQEIIDDVITDNRWLTLEQYVIILKKGLSKDLTDYNTFCLTNLKGWIEAYRIKHLKVIGVQRMYESSKVIQSYGNKTKVEIRVLKITEFKKQLLSLKIVLQNPELIKEVQTSGKSEFKKSFERLLKIQRHYQGYSLDLVYDYLMARTETHLSAYELVKDAKIEGMEILDAIEATPSQEIKNNFALTRAKTNYIITFAKSLIENKEVDEFLEEFVNKYTTKK